MKRHHILTSSLLAIAGALAICPSAAFAQDSSIPSSTSADAAQPEAAAAQPAEQPEGDGTIIVTAQRRAERGRDVPISITNIGAEQLERAGAENLSDIAELTPGLRFDFAGSFFQPTIRGIGTGITTSGSGPNVGIYVDGFLVPNPGSAAFDLANIQSIQVLKGPQGTLFGRSTTGGAILVTTGEPSTETAMSAVVQYGSFNELRAQGYVTLGLTDRIAIDLEGLYRQGDGYFTNIVNNDNRVGRFQNWTIRAGARIEFSDDASLLLRYIHSNTDDPTSLMQNAFTDANGAPLTNLFVTPTVTTTPRLVAFNPAQPVSYRNNSDTAQATLRWDLGFANFTSYTQYRKDEAPNFQDLDISPVNFTGLFVGIDNEAFTQEFLLTSQPGSPLQWTFGLFYLNNTDSYDVRIDTALTPNYALLSGSATTTRTIAGFADLTYEINPQLFVTGGLRYSSDTVYDAYFIIPGSGRRTFVDDYTTQRLTGRFVLRYKPTERSSIYASYSRGARAGILNVGGNVSGPEGEIAPEDVNAFELGYKFESPLFSFDAAAFYYDYKNLQLSSFQNGTARIRNAASSEIYGAEAQVRFTPFDGFDINAGASYVHARYQDFPNAPFIRRCVAGDPPAACFIGTAGFIEATRDQSGGVMQRAPEFTANLGASYQFAIFGGNLRLSGNLYYTSEFYFDAAEQFLQDGYALVGLRAEWRDAEDHFRFGVFADNVTDEEYRTGGNFATAGVGSVWSAPATVGAFAGFRF